MGSGLTTVVLTLLLAAQLCEFAATNGAHVDRCLETKEPGLTWSQFCESILHRRCQVTPGSDPSCEECQGGFKDLGSAACAPVGCPAIEGLENGKLQGTCQAAEDMDVCAFICDAGFAMEGRNQVFCKGFQWDSPPPVCKEPKKCRDLDGSGVALSNKCDDLHRVCKDGTAQENQVTCGKCKEGYVKNPTDRNDREFCLERKKCTDLDESGVALSKKCDALQRVCLGGTAQSNEVTCGRCKEGHVKNPDDKNDQEFCFALMKCSDRDGSGAPLIKKCDDLNRVCRDGTTLVNKVTCGDCKQGFSWETDELCVATKKCSDMDESGVPLRKRCDDLQRTCRSGTEHDNEVTCGGCKPGFLSDPSDLNDDKPCIAMECPTIPGLENGVLRGDCQRAKADGDMCMFYCYNGFVLEGRGHVICKRTAGKLHWDSPPPVCKARSCPAIHGLKNGLLKGDCQTAVKDGLVCEFTCISGFVLQGNDRTVCKETGGILQWDSPLPFCKAAMCTDWKDNTGETWNSFCRKQEGRECLDVAPGQPPRCTCKEGCKEIGDGSCACDQKDK